MEDPEPSCKRGRPREFCPEAALDAALGVFWRHGYEGASLSDLTAAMGINRPSLYAAFGNKEELFRRAVDRYAERAGACFAAALAEPTARAAVERALRETVASVTDCRRPAGCFLVVAAMSGGPASQALLADVAARRRLSTAPAFADRFDRAVAAGELPPGTDTAALAVFFATVLQGVSVQAANGVSRADLDRAVGVALRAWPTVDPLAPGSAGGGKRRRTATPGKAGG